MDIQAITTMIGSLGFPIVIALILIWYIKEEQDKMRETLGELKTAITRLIDRIDKLGENNAEERK